MKASTVIACLALLVTSSLADSPGKPPARSSVPPDGAYWVGLAQAEKTAFLKGAFVGIDLLRFKELKAHKGVLALDPGNELAVTRSAYLEGTNDKAHQSPLQADHALLLINSERLLSDLDWFYSDQSFESIAIDVAIDLVRGRQWGYSDEDIRHRARRWTINPHKKE